MRLSQLRTFVAVAREGGVGAAARALHVSQPTLTAQIHALEAQYGVELFRRQGRGVALTEAGQRLFALTSRIGDIERDAVQLLRDTGELRTGFLAVGAVSPYQVTDVLARFGQRYPGVRVKVSFGNSERVLDDLLASRVDVAVLAHFADLARVLTFAYSRDPIVLLVPAGHAFARRRAVRIGELAGQRMVVREEGSTARKVFEAALARAGVSAVVVMEVGSREGVREAVAKGIGIGFVARAAITPDSRVRIVAIIDSDAATETHVACQRGREHARAIEAFLDIAREAAPLQRGVRSRSSRNAPQHPR